MLGRVKRWLLAMLTLPRTQCSPSGSSQAFCRECGTGLRVAPVPPRRAALLTRPALRGVLEVSGRRASRKPPPYRAGSPRLRRVEQRAGRRKKEEAETAAPFLFSQLRR